MVSRIFTLNNIKVWAPVLVILMAPIIGIISLYDLTIALLLVLAPPVLLIIIWRPYYGVLAFLCMVPIEALLTTSGGVTWLRYLGIGILAIWIGEIIIHKRKINFRWPAWFYLIYVVWALISISWASTYQYSLQGAWTYIQLSLFFILLIDQVNSLQRLKWALAALVVGGMMAVILGNTVAHFNALSETLIVTGQAAPTIFAYPLGFSMILFGIMAMAGKGKVRLIGVVFFILGIFPVVGTGFRGVLVAIAVGLTAAAMTFAKSLRSLIAVILVGGLLFGGVIYILNTNVLPESLISHYSLANFVEASGRWIIWSKAMGVFLRNPVFGLGMDQFSHQIFNYPMIGGFHALGTHNDYVDALVNLGLPGLLFLLLGEGSVLFSLFKIRRQITRQDMVWYSFLVGLFFASIAGQNFVNLFYWKYSWIIRALIIATAWIPVREQSSTQSPRWHVRDTNQVEFNVK